MSDNQNSDRLVNLVGFDPAKKQNLTQDLFKELVEEAQKERLATAKEAARGKLRKAMELREQVYALENKFRSERQKFEKEIGKLLNEIESGLHNRPAPAEEVETPSDPQ